MGHVAVIVVVSDTSPVRALDHIGKLPLLKDLFRTVYAPPAMIDELKRAGCLYRAAGYLTVRAPTASSSLAELRHRVDPGEAEAIALALEIKPDYLLVDDLDARREAQARGVDVLGVLGLLVRAKAAGHIAWVMPLVKELEAGLSFYVSDELRTRIQKLARE